MRWLRCNRSLFRLRFISTASFVIIVGLVYVVLLYTGLYNITLSRLHTWGSQWNRERNVMFKKSIINPVPGEYRLENPYKTDFSRGQSKIIDDLLGRKEGGFFLDIGAGNGETNSVSLFFERERKWRGVLVEVDKAKHRWSVIKNRQSYMCNLRIKFDKVLPNSDHDITPEQLFAIVDRKFIDLLIVNLNGFELDLISHIDLTKYDIRIITIELQNDMTEERYKLILEILTTNGYKAAHYVINSFQGKKDVIFIKQK